MGPLILGAGLLGLLGIAALASRGGRGRTVRDRSTPRRVCTMSAAAIARDSESARFAWLECDGRTALQAAELARRLRAAGNPSGASNVETRWNAIRQVAQSRPDGQLTSPEARAEAEAAERGESPRGNVEMGEVSIVRTSDARRLVAGVVRALRARTNYRRPLTEFQRAAGILADGRYGPQSYNALRYYGGDPPMPFVRGDVNDPANQYPPSGLPYAGGESDATAYTAGALRVQDNAGELTITHQHNGGQNV